MTPAQIATFLISICASSALVLAVPSGNHTCTGITKIPVTVLVNVTVPVTFRSYTWCLRVPPRCSKYTTQLRDRVQLHTEMHNKTITVCCRGYVEMDGHCVPACPEGADCPFMHCNRTNHCQCTPGYTGLYCNDPCPRGVWGRDCKRPCDCPTGYTCHHLTGDCFVDDRPARKTTTTSTTTTTKRPTTTVPPITTEATTLETVKTPQFRFPPPPWVEAPTTQAKKLTTRVVRDDTTSPTTVHKLVQTTFPPTVPFTTERPPVIEFFTPPVTAPTTVIIEPPKETKPSFFLPPTTEVLTTTTTKTTSDTPIPSTSAKTKPLLIPITFSEIETTLSTFTETQSSKPASTSPPTTPTTPLTTPTTPLTTPTMPLTTPTTPPTTPTTPPTTPTTPPTTPTTPPTTVLTTELTTSPTTSTTMPPTTPTTKGTTTVSPTETTPLTIEIPILIQTKPIESSSLPITETTKVTPQKEVIEEKTTVIPEFKVIKVIKTEQSTSKVHKLPIPKYQTPPDQISTIKLLPKNQPSDVIAISVDPVGTNFKTTVHHHTHTKGKKEGSPIIYISPTFKEKTSDVGTTTSGTSSRGTQTPTIHISSFPKDLTTPEKPAGNTIENQVSSRELHSVDDIGISTTTTTAYFAPPTIKSTEHMNRSLLYTNIPNPEIMKIPQSTLIDSTKLDKEGITTELSNKAYESSTISATKKEADIQDTSQITKKKNKDFVTKKFDEKLMKKVTQLRTTTSTLSPIHLLKQLLNATSKPRRTTTTEEPTFDWGFEEHQEKIPLLQVEENEELDYKKSKFDDLIVLSTDKGKKKQEKGKQSKHSKDLKDSKPEKQGHIVTVPPITVTITPTTEVVSKNIIPDNDNIKINLSTKGPYKEENDNHFSLEKPEDPTLLSTTHLPNNIWAALDPQVNVPSVGTTNSNEHLSQVEDYEQFKQNSIVKEITEPNSHVESNTIDTLHTSFESEIRKGFLQQQEDVNYSLVHNKMELVRTEVAYPQSSNTGYTAMTVTLGVGLVTLVALTATLWLFLRRRKVRPPVRPYIMAYELSEPPPLDMQDLEETFFCPTFTNNYAEKINRELLEMSYDHPRSSQPEPLYAEIRY